MNIVFIGGLKNGRMCLDYLDKNHNILKAYVLNEIYSNNVSDFVSFDGCIEPERLVKIRHISEHEDEIISLGADYIVVVGWSQLISQKIIDSAKFGCIGFHPAKLPLDRGRSVLAWQIAEGYTKGHVTMFIIDSGVDSGPVIGQMEYEINYADTIKEVLEKVNNLCLLLLKQYFPLLVEGTVRPMPQNNAFATYRRLRKKADGVIDWNTNSREIYNLVRAITAPYPGAISYYQNKEITVLSCTEQEDENNKNKLPPGTIIDIKQGIGAVVKAKNGNVILTEIIINNQIINRGSIHECFTIGESLGRE